MLGPVPLPVRSPVTVPSGPTAEPPQLVKVSGRLLQVRVASLLATGVPLGTSTRYTACTCVPTSSRAKSRVTPPASLVATVTPAGSAPGA